MLEEERRRDYSDLHIQFAEMRVEQKHLVKGQDNLDKGFSDLKDQLCDKVVAHGITLTQHGKAIGSISKRLWGLVITLLGLSGTAIFIVVKILR